MVSLVTAAGAATIAASAQTPTPASAKPSSQRLVATTTSSLVPPATRVLVWHKLRRSPPGAETARSANASARSFPTPDAYINSALYYDYEPGRLYEVQTSPHFLTTITLHSGEKLLAKAAGDTVRWVLGETASGSGPNQQVVILLKPIRGGLRTNVVLTTDQRIYLIEAASHEGGGYTSAVSWNYPQEQMQALAAADAAKAQSTVADAVAIDQLHFGYRVQAVHSKPPPWQPVRVFDDGTKTYVQFPINMAATDAPPLFLIGQGDKVELVNYRFLNGYYVIDKVVHLAELRLGENPQIVVRITRTKDRS